MYIYIYIFIIKSKKKLLFLNKCNYLDILQQLSLCVTHCRRFCNILKKLLKNKNVFFNLIYV